MKIIVPLKHVVDTGSKVRVRPDGSGIDPASVRMVVNPFDEIALEEAVRLKEAGVASEVIAVTIGPAKAAEALRAALACGADRAIRVDHEGGLDPLGVARALRALVEREGVRLVLAGKQSIDGDGNQVGQMLAALLDWPQATFASSIAVEGETVTVVREVDAGLQTLRLTLPAVVTADLRLNTPRYASLPNIMKAKKKSLEDVSLAALGVEAPQGLAVIETSEPPPRAKGVMVRDVDELLGRLRDDARILP